MEPRIPIDRERIALLCHKWQVDELAFFGSVLRRDFGPDSDVDVLITFRAGAPWSLWDLHTIRGELEEIFGKRVDLVEEKALRNPFRRRAILSGKQVIYAGSRSMRHGVTLRPSGHAI